MPRDTHGYKDTGTGTRGTGRGRGTEGREGGEGMDKGSASRSVGDTKRLPGSGTGTATGTGGGGGSRAGLAGAGTGLGSWAGSVNNEWEGGEVAVLSREDWNLIVDYFSVPDRRHGGGSGGSGGAGGGGRGGGFEVLVDYNRFCDAVLNPEEIKKVRNEWCESHRNRSVVGISDVNANNDHIVHSHSHSHSHRYLNNAFWTSY